MDCIFCKIISGEIDSAKIWEDEKHLAILDVNPNVKGMALVITKKHFDSEVFDMPQQDYASLMLASKQVGRLLEKFLEVKRVALVAEGLGINHAHIKLYPLYGLQEKFQEMWSKDRVYFDKYEGYITTQLGPQQKLDDLKKLAETFRKDV